MNVVIVDDEIHAISEIVRLLKFHEILAIKKTFTVAAEALEYLTTEKVDVLFIDINMPNKCEEITDFGIRIAQEVKYIFPSTKICFVTAHDKYARKAFDLNAIDYLKKPCSQERFDKTIKKILNNKNINHDMNDLFSNFETDTILCSNDEETMLINYSDIYYIEKIGRSIFIHTNENKFIGNKPLSFYEEKLKSKSFFRCHNSFIVNLKRVYKFVCQINYTYDIYFKGECMNNTAIPLSRQKVKILKNFFKN
ncbi:MAG: LytTR family DNA-binding domain-containing protein [Clostridiales bacterium]